MRELHELPFTEIVKSGTYRLASYSGWPKTIFYLLFFRGYQPIRHALGFTLQCCCSITGYISLLIIQKIHWFKFKFLTTVSKTNIYASSEKNHCQNIHSTFENLTKKLLFWSTKIVKINFFKFKFLWNFFAFLNVFLGANLLANLSIVITYESFITFGLVAAVPVCAGHKLT